jgi:hypothetical protein
VAETTFLVTGQSARAPSNVYHIHFEGRATGATAEFDAGGLTGDIALSSAIDGAGPIAENGMIHPVGAMDAANANEFESLQVASCKRWGSRPEKGR